MSLFATRRVTYIKSPLRPLGREGTPVVPPRLTHCLIKNSLCDATGRKKPASLFVVSSLARHWSTCHEVTLRDNGCSSRIGLLTRRCSPFQLGGPFGFCAFALLSPRTARLS